MIKSNKIGQLVNTKIFYITMAVIIFLIFMYVSYRVIIANIFATT